MSDLLPSTLVLLACPVCWKALAVDHDAAGESIVACSGCGRRYPVIDGIPVLIPSRSV